MLVYISCVATLCSSIAAEIVVEFALIFSMLSPILLIALPAEPVAKYVLAGLISHGKAKRDYGVVFTKNGINPRATYEERVRRRALRTPLADFAFGPERGGYDRIWPGDVRYLLATEVL